MIRRSEETLERLFGGESGAEFRTWNADSVSAAAALEGIESAIYLVGVPYDRFELHPRLMRATLAAALASGVKRMLLVGTVYLYGLPQARLVDESHRREPRCLQRQMRKRGTARSCGEYAIFLPSSATRNSQ